MTLSPSPRLTLPRHAPYYCPNCGYQIDDGVAMSTAKETSLGVIYAPPTRTYTRTIYTRAYTRTIYKRTFYTRAYTRTIYTRTFTRTYT